MVPSVAVAIPSSTVIVADGSHGCGGGGVGCPGCGHGGTWRDTCGTVAADAVAATTARTVRMSMTHFILARSLGEREEDGGEGGEAEDKGKRKEEERWVVGDGAPGSKAPAEVWRESTEGG